MSPEQGAAVAHAVPMSLDRVASTVELTPPAFALAHRWNHPVYDCFYVALAAEEQAPLVTDDARVLALAKKAGLSRWVRPLAGFAKQRS